jgi:hypothetical protein
MLAAAGIRMRVFLAASLRAVKVASKLNVVFGLVGRLGR